VSGEPAGSAEAAFSRSKALVLVSSTLILVACQSVGQRGPSAIGSPAATNASSSSPAPPAAAARSRTPRPVHASQSSPANGTDAYRAEKIVQAYLDALASGLYSVAWDLLAASAGQLWGSESAFAAERRAFYESAGPTFSVSTPDSSRGSRALWIASSFDGDRDRAYVFIVDHPRIQSNASQEVLIVAPDSSGEWRIWIGR
jgi:hypothetical protein